MNTVSMAGPPLTLSFTPSTPVVLRFRNASGSSSGLSTRRNVPSVVFAIVRSKLALLSRSSSNSEWITAPRLAACSAASRASTRLDLPSVNSNPTRKESGRPPWSKPWQELRAWVEQSPTKLLQHRPILGAYLRALGELGELDEMLRVFRPLAMSAQVLRDPSWITTATMVVAALAGLPEEVRRMEEGVLRFLPGDVLRFWHATALQAAGRVDEAEEVFAALQQEDRPTARLAIAHRLKHPLAAVPKLSPDMYEEIHRTVAVEAGRSPPEDHQPLRPWATWLVVVVNALAYLAEVPGGTENGENLYELGALVVPPQPGDGWWRLVTAGFLHAGPLHLFLNLVGIWYFGRRLERRIGHVPFLLTFLVAGPLAMRWWSASPWCRCVSRICWWAPLRLPWPSWVRRWGCCCCAGAGNGARPCVGSCRLSLPSCSSRARSTC